MSNSIWFWTEGEKKIFTRKPDVVQKAKRKGFLVESIKDKPHIFRKSS